MSEIVPRGMRIFQWAVLFLAFSGRVDETESALKSAFLFLSSVPLLGEWITKEQK